jgi:hypothetical protein
MMAHSACVLVAVVLVQSSVGAPVEPEVTARGYLRGDGDTVTAAARSLGLNETAAVDGQLPGGFSQPQAPDEGCKEAVEEVKASFSFQTNCNPSVYTPVSCSAQVVAGMNYIAKVDVSPCAAGGFAQLRIFKGLGKDDPASLDDVEYVASNATRGALLTETGSGCVKTNEPCPSDPTTCCSGSCGPLGGFVADLGYVCE